MDQPSSTEIAAVRATSRPPVVFAHVQFTTADSRTHYSTTVSSTGGSYSAVVAAK